MAGEIKVPCRIWPHPSINANAYEDTMAQTNGEFVPIGLVLPDDAISRICFETSEPIPEDLHATPNGNLRVGWKTPDSSTALFFQIVVKAASIAPGESEDPTGAGWTLDTNVQDTSTGQYEKTEHNFSLSGLTLTKGDYIKGYIQRDATSGNGSDTLANLVLITDIHFIADAAA